MSHLKKRKSVFRTIERAYRWKIHSLKAYRSAYHGLAAYRAETERGL
ncbi:hypothetical protein N6H14_19015 [Paenibacillus sp. CC-CFT747]|nr:hypothetical protein N6H14_19015 [Paenibacillus sp. CC-CFT747]